MQVDVPVDATDNAPAGDPPATDSREDEHTPGTTSKYLIRGEERRVRQYVEQRCKDWCGYTEVPEPHRRMEGFRAVVDELHRMNQVCIVSSSLLLFTDPKRLQEGHTLQRTIS